MGSDRQRVHYYGQWYPARKPQRMRPIEDSLDAVAPEFEDIGPVNAAKCGLRRRRRVRRTTSGREIADVKRMQRGLSPDET